jgi:hypothetical protein
MSYQNRKWMVSFQDDGVLEAMNGWYYICDKDGGIVLGYFKDKNVVEDIVTRLNDNRTYTWIKDCPYDQRQHSLYSMCGPISPEYNADIRAKTEAEQDLETFGMWDCSCGYRNIIPPDTITIKCDKCGKPRKFDIIEKND